MSSTETAPTPHPAVFQLQACREFFERSTSVFTDQHAGFAPKPEMLSVVKQIAHVADAFDWFHDALVDLQGFDMEFEAMEARIMKAESLPEARAWFVRAHQRLTAWVAAAAPDSFGECLPTDDPVMPGASRVQLIGTILDHTAHHRGSLVVYARMLGLTPLMPYGEMPE